MKAFRLALLAASALGLEAYGQMGVRVSFLHYEPVEVGSNFHFVAGFDADLARRGVDYAPTYWVDTAGPPPEDDGPVSGDLDVDVAIVGSGFTGLATALFLAREHGIRATVRAGAGTGATLVSGNQFATVSYARSADGVRKSARQSLRIP